MDTTRSITNVLAIIFIEKRSEQKKDEKKKSIFFWIELKCYSNGLHLNL